MNSKARSFKFFFICFVASFLMCGFVMSDDENAIDNVSIYLQSAGIDFDGNGEVSTTERLLLDLMLKELGLDNPVISEIDAEDAGSFIFIQSTGGGLLSNPKGIAVDGRTGRIFVSGTKEINNQKRTRTDKAYKWN